MIPSAAALRRGEQLWQQEVRRSRGSHIYNWRKEGNLQNVQVPTLRGSPLHPGTARFIKPCSGQLAFPQCISPYPAAAAACESRRASASSRRSQQHLCAASSPSSFFLIFLGLLLLPRCLAAAPFPLSVITKPFPALSRRGLCRRRRSLFY